MTLNGPFPTLTGAGARRLLKSTDRVIVVGAGGWLGLATLEALHQLLGARFAERVVAYGSNRRELRLRGGLVIQQSALSELAFLSSAPSLVLHFAFLTQEKAKVMSDVDYIAANRAISARVLSALDLIGATGVFVASSGAVYMADDPNAENSKRLYGQLKMEDEARFSLWAEHSVARAVIARVFNVAGPYVGQGAYALSAFIADALAGRAITIHARRPVWRSYVAINELMSVVVGLLTSRKDGAEVFDTAGPVALEMTDIARAVAETLAPAVSIARATLDHSAPDRYIGDGKCYQNSRQYLGVNPVGFAEQIRQTASFMAQDVGSR